MSIILSVAVLNKMYNIIMNKNMNYIHFTVTMNKINVLLYS